jgi:hypothetical protein
MPVLAGGAFQPIAARVEVHPRARRSTSQRTAEDSLENSAVYRGSAVLACLFACYLQAGRSGPVARDQTEPGRGIGALPHCGARGATCNKLRRQAQKRALWKREAGG